MPWKKQVDQTKNRAQAFTQKFKSFAPENPFPPFLVSRVQVGSLCLHNDWLEINCTHKRSPSGQKGSNSAKAIRKGPHRKKNEIKTRANFGCTRKNDSIAYLPSTGPRDHEHPTASQGNQNDQPQTTRFGNSEKFFYPQPKIVWDCSFLQTFFLCFFLCWREKLISIYFCLMCASCWKRKCSRKKRKNECMQTDPLNPATFSHQNWL